MNLIDIKRFDLFFLFVFFDIPEIQLTYKIERLRKVVYRKELV